MLTRCLLYTTFLALLVGGTCTEGSCVQFDGQTVLLHHDAGGDRLNALLIYRNVHSTADDMSDAIHQVEKIRDGARWFAFASNWPIMFNIDDLLDDDFDTPEAAAFVALLGENIEVRSEPAWLDAAGHLTGAQLIRASRASSLLAAANEALLAPLRTEEGLAEFAEEMSLDDPESVALMREAMRRGHTFLELRGSALTFALPASDEGFTAIKRELLRELRDSLADRTWNDTGYDSESEAMLEFLALNDWAVERTPGLVTFVLGDPSRETVRLVVPAIGIWRPGFVEALQEQGWTIATDDGEADALRSFEEFCAGS
jgi:hypothetical protein